MSTSQRARLTMTTRIASLWMVLGLCVPVPASADWVCAKDLNGDGDFTGFGETASCAGASICPLGDLPCVDGQCSQDQACREQGEAAYACSLDQRQFASAAECSAQCQGTETYQEWVSSGYYRSEAYIDSWTCAWAWIITTSPPQTLHQFHALAPPRPSGTGPNRPTASQCAALIPQIPVSSMTITSDVGYQNLPATATANNRYYAEPHYSTRQVWMDTSHWETRTRPVSGECRSLLEFVCDATGRSYPDQSSCDNECRTTAECSLKQLCPLGDEPCIDLTATPPKVDTLVSQTLADDGQRDPQGLCLDQIYIFDGRGMECRPGGIDTGFSSCCKDDAVYQDNAAGLQSLVVATKVIKAVYGMASAAYSAWEGGVALTGAARVAAAQAGAEMYLNNLLTVPSPQAIAVQAAIYVATKLLTKQCKQMDIETSALKGSKYCHKVGTYCQKRWPFFGCVQKADAYCCYNSKLARIINEQGRPQLPARASWGDPKSPDCRGFTPDEFRAIDFSRIDLSEYIEDISRNTRSLITSDLETKVQDFYRQIP